MNYAQRLSPWCIVKLLPNLQNSTVARCRRRNDAEEHIKVLRRLMPDSTFTIVFDPGLETKHLPDAEDLID
jgi:hypothetical protein